MLPTLICLAVSTVLNTVYFLRTVLTIFTPSADDAARREEAKPFTRGVSFKLSVLCFIVINLVLGLLSDPIVEALQTGLHMFS